MGSDQAKQFVDIDGKPLLALTLKPFQLCQAVDAVIAVVPSNNISSCQKEIIERYHLGKVKKVVAGGPRRQDSVRLGLEAIDGEYDLVIIHDGVRPLITEKAIYRIIDAAKSYRAVISGLPAKETVKEVDSNQEVIGTFDRRRIWLIQTPQIFRYEDILKAHQKALQENWDEATDDSVLVEKLGIKVNVIEGYEQNIKVTTRNDLELVKFLLNRLNW